VFIQTETLCCVQGTNWTITYYNINFKQKIAKCGFLVICKYRDCIDFSFLAWFYSSASSIYVIILLLLHLYYYYYYYYVLVTTPHLRLFFVCLLSVLICCFLQCFLVICLWFYVVLVYKVITCIYTVLCL
jgi:hypothetical protein